MKDFLFTDKALEKILGILLLCFLSSCALKTETVSENDGMSFNNEHGLCHNVNPGSQLHPVIICENKEMLTFSVLKTQIAIEKKALEKEIFHQLRSLVMATDIDPKYRSTAEVDVWISAPVLYPERAELVVVVKGATMGFAFFLPPDMKHWNFLQDSVVQLGASGYPSMQTWKTGRLVMAAERSIKNADWLSLKQEMKLRSGQTPSGMPRIKNATFNGEGIVVETAQFSEAYVAAFVQQTKIGKKYKLRPVWIPAVESDSYKAKGYTFKLDI
jgi:hypothetical protein